MERTRALIVSGDSESRERLRDFMVGHQVDVWEADAAARGVALLHRHPFDLLVAGADVLEAEGPRYVANVRSFDEHVGVIAIVESPDAGRAALAEGAYDFFLEPVDLERLAVVLFHVREAAEARDLSEVFEQQVEGASPLDSLITRDPRMIRLFSLARRLGRYDTPVLIAGEAGTGKESIARALHAFGRGDAAFVVLQSAGATTAQLEQAIGEARGGTLYIDDILGLGPEVAAALVTLVDEGSAVDNGGPRVRLIAACREDAGRRCARGTIQEDLYLRLSEAALRLPALRDRREDVVPIARALLHVWAGGEEPPTFGRDVADALVAYDWPGNVDELRATIESAGGTARGRAIELRDLPPPLRVGQPAAQHAELESRRLADIEAAHLKKALAETRGNKARAARILGLSRWALQRKLQKHGISTEELRS